MPKKASAAEENGSQLLNTPSLIGFVERRQILDKLFKSKTEIVLNVDILHLTFQRRRL